MIGINLGHLADWRRYACVIAVLVMVHDSNRDGKPSSLLKPKPNPLTEDADVVIFTTRRSVSPASRPVSHLCEKIENIPIFHLRSEFRNDQRPKP